MLPWSLKEESFMIICFECPREVKDIIDRLVKQDLYTDMSEVITTAVLNLDVLRKAVNSEGSLVLESTAFGPASVVEKDSDGKELQRHKSPGRPRTVPALFRHPAPKVDLRVGENRILQCDQEPPLPPKDWVFGMYNKLLPLKSSCRAVANIMSTEYPHGIPISQFEQIAANVAEEATALGDYLRKIESKYDMGRDDLLSLGFPSRGKEEKSKHRFATQFVGRLSNQQVGGFMAVYGLLSTCSEERPVAAITQAGYDFACLENPILDGMQPQPREVLSSQERTFLLDHLENHVPYEWWLITRIAQTIGTGRLSSADLDSEIAAMYTPKLHIEPHLSTARSGAVSRMIDLGVVRRIREGRNIFYELGHEEGTQLLTKLTNK